jgi:glycosyltransferase involved in cell wall biosynthesis
VTVGGADARVFAETAADPVPRSQSIAVTVVAHDVGGVGGMERQLQILITRLLDHGVSVDVVTRTFDLPERPGLLWRRVPGPSRPFPLAYPWFMLAAGVILLRRRRGVLHTTGAIVLNRSDVCTVHYVHNGKAHSVDRGGRATYLYRVNAAVARRMSRFGERLIYSSPGHSRVLVAVSKPVGRELEASYPRRRAVIRVIENGVDTNRFRPDADARREIRGELAVDRDLPLALFMASEWRRKGAHLAVSALEGARSWHLAVVGRGDARELLELAERLMVGSRLHLVPETTRPERYYAAADAFVLPSAYESFSLAAFEAAAAGLPVVATNVGAVSEIVKVGGGMLIERTSAALAGALNDLERDPVLRGAMSARARAAVKRFDWDAVVTEYVGVYRESGVIAFQDADEEFAE